MLSYPVTFTNSWSLYVLRPDVLDRLIELQNFRNHFLPNALRCFFRETHPPNERSDYLSTLVDKFSQRFCKCNPQLGLSQGKAIA